MRAYEVRIIDWSSGLCSSDLDALQPGGRVQRTERGEAAVGGGRSADAHDHAGGAHVECGDDELADALGRGRDGVVALGPAHEVETRREGHLDDRGPPVEAPADLDRSTARAGHRRRAGRAAAGVERPLPTGGHRHLDRKRGEVDNAGYVRGDLRRWRNIQKKNNIN